MESVVALNKENLRRKKRKSDQANGKTANGKKSKTFRETAHQVKKEDSSSSESSEESSDEEESDFTKSLRQKFGLQKGEPIPSPSARLLQKAKSPSVGMATNAILFS